MCPLKQGLICEESGTEEVGRKSIGLQIVD